MADRIYKYELDWSLGQQTIMLPADAEILTAQMQHKSLCFWAKVDITRELEERTFYLAFTGTNLGDIVFAATYLTTVQDQDGLVWHIYYFK